MEKKETMLEKLKCICHTYDPEELDKKRKAAQEKSSFPPKPTAPQKLDDLKIHPLVEPMYDDLVKTRRHLHTFPEVSFCESETSKYVAGRLEAMRLLDTHNPDCLKIVTGIADHGIIAYTYGTGPAVEFPVSVDDPTQQTYCVLLRADMDGLPITEVPSALNEGFMSTNGAMHACGHDGHMSMLLTAATIMTSNTYRATLPSNFCIKFCFQPAEELHGGAKYMIDEGILENSDVTGPYVNSVYACHLWSYTNLGHIWTRNGSFMAANDRLFITVNGSGGHGAMPQGTKDAIVIASHLVCQLQTIVSRNISPVESGVVSIGTLNAGYSDNIIADKAVMTGTVRSLNRETQLLLKKRIEEICNGIAASFDCEVVCRYMFDYPVTINDASCIDVVVGAGKKIVGDAYVHDDVLPTMGAEDFSFFLNQRPGAFYFVGANPDGNLAAYPHHKSNFTINEDALPVGASMFVHIIDDIVKDFKLE